MPSRSIPPQQQQQSPPLITPSPSQSQHHHHHHSNLVPPIAGAVTAAFSLLLFLTICFRKITRKRTVPADSKPPHRYSYSVLRRATDSFSPSNLLGQGGFGSVFRGTLPAASPSNNNNNQQKQIAVKVMDSGSLQGEREFQNEIFLASKVESDSIVSVLGFSSDRKRRRMLLVYELMSNGNLQDALLHKKLPELTEWKKRFSVAVDIAKGLDYLHGLNPPVIHGDIKPSNILLDQYFSAKIADLGLARLKEENNQDQCEITVVETDNNGGGGGGGGAVEEHGSVVEETESVTESNLGVDQSPESLIRASSTAGSLELSSEVDNGKTSGKGMKSGSVKEWWWKQENGGVVVKDYVMEWIGTEIKKERPKSDWIEASSSSYASNNGISSSKLDKKKKHKKRLDWWVSLDDDKEKKNSKSFKKEKRRPAREWWKEEYCEELAKKKKKKIKKKEQMGVSSDGDWWPRDEEMYVERKKKSRSRGSRGSSIDWWLDGLSGELFRGRRNSHDSGGSGEIPKSGGISSTPSMRGTVCYVAPEYGGGGDLSEKCDVYSFGVLLLVLIAGRRPLQVTGSPMSEFQRANLLSWARHLARNGKLIDLVDKAVQSLDREQALLCITIALLCLQKLPARRPSMKEIVAMLTGESQPPQLPTEFSPSPPSRLPYKSHKKAR